MHPSHSPPRRACGMLLHITSLPGLGGVGDLGAAAHDFVDALQRARQGLWQVLPLGPTGYGDSPYQAVSAFAGNPLLVSLEVLRDQGLLDAVDVGEAASAPPSRDRADYGAAHGFRLPRLERAAVRLLSPEHRGARDDYEAFCAAQRGWLEDYALFMAIKEAEGGQPFYAWPAPLRDRDAGALEEARARLADRLHFFRFTQWQFHRQWGKLREHAGRCGVRLIGDMPIFVAHDSVEVWTGRRDFLLNADASLRVQAGVPPDYFSETGQLWGNPLYDWERMAQGGFQFWRRRLEHALSLYDRVRIDHFRGFSAHWEVPGDAKDARGGRWVEAPGHALFETLFHALGERLDLIAEDLGIITPDVEALRDRFGLPGMRVLQFAFGDGEPEKVRPYGYVRNMVAYTSTHDNDTAAGWLAGGDHVAQRDDELREQRNCLEYLGMDRDADLRDPGIVRVATYALLRLAFESVCDTVIVTAQDVLALGSEARMNRPGLAAGNWGFRLLPGQLTDEPLAHLAHLARTYGRESRRS